MLAVAILYAFYGSPEGLLETMGAEESRSTVATSQLGFKENKGQWDSDALFCGQGNGTTAWVTKRGVTYQFFKSDAVTATQAVASRDRDRAVVPAAVSSCAVNVEFLGGRVSQTEGLKPAEDVSNYFIGNDSRKWATGVKRYAEVWARNVWPGIDARLYHEDGRPRYDFIVQPGAKVEQIRLNYDGARNLRVTRDGRLRYENAFGTVEERGLRADQGATRVPIETVVQGQTVQFQLGKFDRSKPLVIDPVVWSTYVGGNHRDEPGELVTLPDGRLAIAGETASTNLPKSTNKFAAKSDLFVTMLGPDGGIGWTTYVGGNSNELEADLVTTPGGGLAISGRTDSTDFAGAKNRLTGTSYDAIVAQLLPSGALNWSFYLGGSNWERVLELVSDAEGRLAVAGLTESNDFVGAGNAPGGAGDGFVARISPVGNLLWARYYGGTADDLLWQLTATADGGFAVAGFTRSHDLPRKTNDVLFYSDEVVSVAFFGKLTGAGDIEWSTHIGETTRLSGLVQMPDGSLVLTGSCRRTPMYGAKHEPRDPENAYVTKTTLDGNIQWTSFVDVYGYNESNSIVKALDGGVVIAGSASPAFGERKASQSPCNPDASLTDGFVSKLSTSGTVEWVTVIGGSCNDYGNMVTATADGGFVVTGSTASDDFRLATNSAKGQTDAYLAKVSALGRPVWSTYVGGSSYDAGTIVTVAADGHLYVLGLTGSSDLDSATNRFGRVSDLFVAKVSDPDLDPGPLVATVNPKAVPWGASAKGTVSLARPAPAGGVVVRLASADYAVTVPDYVIVPASKTEQTFDISTSIVLSSKVVGITATSGKRVSTARLIVQATGATTLPANTMEFRDGDDIVDGIVCDNTYGSAYGSRDGINGGVHSIRVQPSSGNDGLQMLDVQVWDADGRYVPNNRGTVKQVDGNWLYTPPLVFNYEYAHLGEWDSLSAGDPGGRNIRPVHLRVLVRTQAGAYAVVFPTVQIARTPTLLVHGTNSNSDTWLSSVGIVAERIGIVKKAGARRTFFAPVSAVNFADGPDGLQGRGTVEAAAKYVADGITELKRRVQAGEPIPPDITFPTRRIYSANRADDWTAWAGWQRKRLSIRRVDVLGHGYGGVVTRWYMNRPSLTTEYTRKWYLSGTPGANVAVAARPYGNDVGRFVTIGGVWGGVPLFNGLTEIAASETDAIPFGNAPMVDGRNLRQSLESLTGPGVRSQDTVRPFDNVKYPAWQVMAVGSLWQNATFERGPFTEGVGYGSVAGDRTNYFRNVDDVYDALGRSQRPSWFPYWSMDSVPGTERNYHDGFVPLWSAILSGRGKIVNDNHRGLLSNDDAIKSAFLQLNTGGQFDGASLNFAARRTSLSPAIAPGTGYQWPMLNLKSVAHAPIYGSSGTGRLNPEAIRERANRTITFVSKSGNVSEFELRIKAQRTFKLEPLSVYPVGFPNQARTVIPARLGFDSTGKWVRYRVRASLLPGEWVLLAKWTATLDQPWQTNTELELEPLPFVVK